MSVAVCLDLELDGDVILCAATAWTNGTITVPQLWTQYTRDLFEPLTQDKLHMLVQFLNECRIQNIAIVTWGGTGSDWKALYAAVDDAHKPFVKELALVSIDIPLISAAASGMMMGLTSAAVGMGLGTRPACDSADVPNFWNSGEVVKQNEVLLHVQWDATTCAALYNALYHAAQHDRPMLTWLTQKTTRRSVRLHRRQGPYGYELPCTREVLTWQPPTPNFQIPDHLQVSHMAGWLSE